MTSQQEPDDQAGRGIIGEKMTFKRVWSNLWGLVSKPRNIIPTIKENDQIGWLLGSIFIVEIILIAIVYLVVYWLIKEKGANLFDFLELFISKAWLSSILMFFYIIFLVIFGVLLGWVTSFFWGHVLANIYGGRGKWWQLAINALYIQLLSLIVGPIVFLLTFLTNFIDNSLIKLILDILFIFAWLVWFICLYTIIIKDVYRLPLWRAIMAVLTPIIIFVLVFGGIYYYVKSSRDNVITDNSTLLNEDFFDYSNINVNLGLGNYNFNTNTNTASDNISPAKEKELSEMESEERLQKMDRTVDYINQRRQNDLFTLKYDLLRYYEVYQQFPVSIGLEKLDGQTDSVYLSLKDFKPFYYGLKDPEHPKYYYSYQSDGQNFTLTGYLTSAKKVLQLKNK